MAFSAGSNISGFSRLQAADDVLRRHIAAGTTPGAVGLVCHREGVAARFWAGRHTYAPEAPPVRPDDRYDLASLTKVIVTTPLCMRLEADGKLDLDAPVCTWIPEFRAGRRTTIRHLLAHCGGLPGHLPLYRTCRSKTEFLAAICRAPLAYAPGRETVYSDLGFLLLGALIERIAGDTLDRLARAFVFDPLNTRETGYCPPPDLRDRIPPTEYDAAWRNRLVHGEVHDENAAALGGVAPHAGLFGAAGDLARFLRLFLRGGELDGHRLFSESQVTEYTTRAGRVPGSTRALGWDTVSETGSSAGRYFSARSYGHLGFTGASLWADPDRDLGVVLLTNRVHPTRENTGIRALRPEFHNAVSEALAEE